MGGNDMELIILIILVVIVVMILKSRKNESTEISVEVVREGLEEALFEKKDMDCAIDYVEFCKERYKGQQYVAEIERMINRYKDYVEEEFEKRDNMNRQELQQLKNEIFVLYMIDSEHKDICEEKHATINQMLFGDSQK